MRIITWLFISCIIVATLGGCHGTNSPTAPLPSGDQNRQQGTPTHPSDDTTDSDIVRAPYPTIIITAVGDSITAGGYPGILEDQLQADGYNVNVQNEGIPGADSATADLYFRSLAREAEIALIMIGTNDVSCPGCCTEPYNCRTLDHLASMVDQAVALGILPILGTITPKNPRDVYWIYNDDIEELNADIYQLGLEKRVRVVETYDPILDNGGSLLFADKHHLNGAGERILADTWYQRLVELLVKPQGA